MKLNSVYSLRRLSAGWLAVGALCLPSVPAVFAQAPADANLVANGNLETPNETGDWAAKWPKPKAGFMSWREEGGDHFIRLEATEPGKMIMLHNLIPLHGAAAVELTIRARVTDLKKGPQNWFDARVIIGFSDSAGKEVKGTAKPVVFGKSTDGWVERKVQAPVPLGAAFLTLMPSLFNVETGVLDFSDVSVKAIDPAQLAPAAN
jgi:endoglucanase